MKKATEQKVYILEEIRTLLQDIPTTTDVLI